VKICCLPLSKLYIQYRTQQCDSIVFSLSLFSVLDTFLNLSPFQFSLHRHALLSHLSISAYGERRDQFALAPQSTRTALTIVSVNDTQCYEFDNLSLPVCGQFCYEIPVFLYSDAALTVLDFSTILSPSILLQLNSDIPPCSLVHRQQIAVALLVTPHILNSRRFNFMVHITDYS